MLNLESTVLDELMTVPEVKDIVLKMNYGKNSLVGIKFVLDHDPTLKGKIRRNEMTGQTDIVGEVPWKRRGIHMTDTDMHNLALYLEENYEFSDTVLEKVVDIVANNNSFHPVRDKLESLTWDGTPRIANALHHFLGAEVNHYTSEIMKMHMLAAIKRVYQPGCKYDIMLCLVGGQGVGKSTFFRYLAMNDEWFTDDIKSLDDKKVYEYIHAHWIIEMSEMHGITNGRSLEVTKSFLTRQKDVYRIPYEKRAEDRYRQCVFCGTSNDMSFLPYDRTGNRRFAPVEVCIANAETLIYANEQESRNYFEQMWAEAMEIFHTGEYSLTFSDEMVEYVKTLQMNFMPEDSQVGMIQQFLDNYEEDVVCTAIIYQQVMGGVGIPQRNKSKEIAEILNNDIVGWSKMNCNHRFGKELGTQRAWKRDEPIKDEDGFLPVPEQMDLPFE